jgi:NAD(P)-dependent dehydrogenase (short-subunit alcohol dehydrogenase family)
VIKNAIVWGASGGIGRALVEQLGADGWTVFAVSRHSDEWAGRTPGVIGIEADVASPAEVERAITAISQEVTEVQLSIYAAGDITSARTKELSAQNWNRILDANLTGVYLTTHYSLPLLAADGHLVFLGAISERLRLPGLGAYAAAKAGLEAFAEALGKEERKRRVTVVRPAAVETPLWDKVPMRLPAHALSPQTVAERILEAYREGHKGSLDLA